jgi:aminomethyltransferase
MALTTALEEAHEHAGAKMTTFAGWRLPVQYHSPLDEHTAVRTHAGMFDVSHMTVTDVSGPQAQDFLRHLLSGDVATLAPCRGRYTCLLAEDGGIIDDVIVYRLSDHEDEPWYRLISNAATRRTVTPWLAHHAARFAALLDERSDLAMLAIQGPRTAELAGNILARSAEVDVDRLLSQPRYGALDSPAAFVARTGYTGEDGWEVCLPHARIEALWESLLLAGVAPCGLAARDTLRLEAGMSLYGADMDESTRPDEVGLGWLVDLRDPARDFIGRQALEQAPAPRRCRAAIVLTDKGIPRAGHDVRVAGEFSGIVTSGSFSPTLRRGIALVRMDVGEDRLPPPPAPAMVGIRSRQVKAELVRPPFVRGTSRTPTQTATPERPV